VVVDGYKRVRALPHHPPINTEAEFSVLAGERDTASNPAETAA
jgi:hypothetical protein